MNYFEFYLPLYLELGIWLLFQPKNFSFWHGAMLISLLWFLFNIYFKYRQENNNGNHS